MITREEVIRRLLLIEQKIAELRRELEQGLADTPGAKAGKALTEERGGQKDERTSEGG